MASQFANRTREFLLGGGYAPGDVIENYLFACLNADGTLTNVPATVAAFSGPPHTMRSACVGAYEIEDATQIRHVLDRARYLTAPLAIVRIPDEVQLFRVHKSVILEPLARGTDDDFADKFRSRIADFSPSELQRVKLSSRRHDLFDVGLWPWAENVTSERLVDLLEAVVVGALDDLPEARRSSEAAKNAVIKLIFHLFACRVLQDKNLIASTDDPEKGLRIAHDMFSDNIDPAVARSPYVTRAMVNKIAKQLRSRFAFSSLTSEMLGTAYENALVTPKLRRDRGIYYTPRSITSYVLSQLPIESIAEDERFLCDPCCGSGSFLLAGFERLAALLPEGMSANRRHQYLRTRLLGFDIDDFAREIATLSLVLADVYNKDGWKIEEADARRLSKAEIGKRPAIIVTNPPFRHSKESGQRHEIAADILVNLIDLLADDGLMGIVLPQSFLDSGAAEKARATILQKCDVLEIDLLSSGLFFSAAEVAIVLMRKRAKDESRMMGVATIREVRSADVAAFKRGRTFTRTYSADPREWRLNQGQRFVVSPLSGLWKRLKAACPSLRGQVKLMAGLQLRATDNKSIHTEKRAGDKRYVDRLDVLRPYALLPEGDPGRFKWIAYGPQLRREADQSVFESEKVLLNSNRNPGSVWRLVAAIAPKGLYFSDNFHAALPRGTIVTVEEIVAVLNGPIANAWFDAHCRKRKIVLKTLGDLPFPVFSSDQQRKIKRLVRQIEASVKSNWINRADALYDERLALSDEAVRMRSELDAIVADGYGLLPDERWQIDRLVSTDRRPG